MNLYQVTEEFNAAIELFVNTDKEQEDTREVLPTLEDWLNETRDNLDKKRLAVAAYIKNQDSDIEAICNAVEELSDRRKKKESSVRWLKESLLNSMHVTETRLVKGVEFDIKIRANPHKVEITDESMVPEDFIILKQEKYIDKARIRETIKMGKLVPGCTLVQNDSIQIK
jgi:hypothetical protein